MRRGLRSALAVFILCFLAASLAQDKPAHRKTPAKKAAPQKAAEDTPIRFDDITRRAGIDFHLTCGSAEKRYIMDAMCGGIAFLDYDRDGWPDIFLLNGSTLKHRQAGDGPSSKLYHNNHDLTFTDVTAKLGLDVRGWGMGVAVGDYDGDGYDDLYLTFLDGARLFHNDQGKHFTDVTEKSGVDNGGRWGTSAAFGDFDGDGKLDLYVANYVDLDLDHLPEFGSTAFCRYRGIPVSCGPRGLKGSRDRLYHNRGDGRFEDVSERLKIDPGAYYGLGVMWLDYNNDGCLDIYVANDSSPSLLYKNDCHGGFTEVAAEAGVAFSSDGQEQAGMGVDAADFDRDGRLDIAKINFSDDTNNLYRNEGEAGFTDVAGPSGFGPVSTPFLGFGVRFVDMDNDGWPDVIVANGHVNPQVDGKSFGVTYAERNLIFHNLGNGRFEELGARAGAVFRTPRVGRGLAAADIDHDGRVDLLISDLDGAPLLLRNVSPAANHWIDVQVEQGIGARVEVTAGAATQIDEVRANSSYLSASEQVVHFGLGKASRVRKITVRWTDGKTAQREGVEADQTVKVPRP